MLQFSTFHPPSNGDFCQEPGITCAIAENGLCHVKNFTENLVFRPGSGCNNAAFTFIHFAFVEYVEDGININDCDFLQDVSFPSLKKITNMVGSAGGIVINNCDSLGSVLCPSLETIVTETAKAIDIKNNAMTLVVSFPSLSSVISTSNIAINVVEAGETACAAFNSLEYVGDQTGSTVNPARLRISDTGFVGLCPAAFEPADNMPLALFGTADLDDNIGIVACDICCPSCPSSQRCDQGFCVPSMFPTE